MPQLIALHDKYTIRAFVMHQPLVYIYEIGDLDDFFGHTQHGTGGLTQGRSASWRCCICRAICRYC